MQLVLLADGSDDLAARPLPPLFGDLTRTCGTLRLFSAFLDLLLPEIGHVVDQIVSDSQDDQEKNL